jgi:hypothetical protein
MPKTSGYDSFIVTQKFYLSLRASNVSVGTIATIILEHITTFLSSHREIISGTILKKGKIFTLTVLTLT